MRLIRMVLGSAVRNQRLVRSPAANLVAPTPGHREMRILTVGQVSDVADALPGRYRSIPVVAAYMGLRFGELAGLKVDAVDMLRRRLEVRRSLKEPPGESPYLGPPKSSASIPTTAR